MKIDEFINKNKDFNVEEYKMSKICAIYFICNNDGLIIYIGRTIDLQFRLNVHLKRKEFSNKLFYFLPCDKSFQIKLERKLIKQIKPKYNITHNKKKRQCSNKKHSVKIGELNMNKINVELAKLGKNWTWLASKLNILPSSVDYIKKVKPLSKAESIAKILKLDAPTIVNFLA